MIDLEVVTSFIYENFSQVKTSKGGTHFLARCLLCGDSKKSKSKRRFNLDYNGGQPIYHCFNCNRSGSFLSLYAEIKALSIKEAKAELFKFNPRRIIEKYKPKPIKAVSVKPTISYHNYIIDDCISITDTPNGYTESTFQKKLIKFYEERQINKDQKILIAYKGDYKNRFIIPIYDGDNVVYFQGRRMNSDMDNKYKNPVAPKSAIIFNRQYFSRDKNIIVTEGLIDAMMIELNQGTSCLGKEITDSFIKLIMTLTDKDVIVAFDNDKDGQESLLKFMIGNDKSEPNKFSKSVKYFLIPDRFSHCKDINKLKTVGKIENIYDFVCSNSFSYIRTYAHLKIVK